MFALPLGPHAGAIVDLCRWEGLVTLHGSVVGFVILPITVRVALELEELLIQEFPSPTVSSNVFTSLHKRLSRWHLTLPALFPRGVRLGDV